ncbi:hypothetical protein EDC01DRAFT_786978 [Geopyxis carbonaria]|nr:hypothetical protein EDC01DRAFT_786978 [Geopyxis carbonaria]
MSPPVLSSLLLSSRHKHHPPPLRPPPSPMIANIRGCRRQRASSTGSASAGGAGGHTAVECWASIPNTPPPISLLRLSPSPRIGNERSRFNLITRGGTRKPYEGDENKFKTPSTAVGTRAREANLFGNKGVALGVASPSNAPGYRYDGLYTVVERAWLERKTAMMSRGELQTNPSGPRPPPRDHKDFGHQTYRTRPHPRRRRGAASPPQELKNKKKTKGQSASPPPSALNRGRGRDRSSDYSDVRSFGCPYPNPPPLLLPFFFPPSDSEPDEFYTLSEQEEIQRQRAGDRSAEDDEEAGKDGGDEDEEDKDKTAAASRLRAPNPPTPPRGCKAAVPLPLRGPPLRGPPRCEARSSPNTATYCGGS